MFIFPVRCVGHWHLKTDMSRSRVVLLEHEEDVSLGAFTAEAQRRGVLITKLLILNVSAPPR